jgi:hypothetical protein
MLEFFRRQGSLKEGDSGIGDGYSPIQLSTDDIGIERLESRIL